MAVKASVQITISKVIDIHACYRYYKLQSSTLAKPSKPTTNPPSGWSDTEPAYVSGSTNTLYFVDCNVYSDKTFNFSEVSVSSSYEAAKAAWNKAKNAQDTANDANGKIDGLQVGGRNMLLGSSFDNLPQVDNTYTKYSNNSVKLVVDNTDGTTNKHVSISSLKQSWSLSDVIGKTITISMWIYIEKVGQLSGYEFRVIYTNKGATKWFEPDTRYPYYIPNASSLSSGWNYVYGSFTIPDDSTRAEFNFTCYATAGKSGYAWFSSPKAEIGNKPTDWTPAPEDMLPKDEAKDIYTTQLEMSKTNSELRLDFTKSIASATDDMQSKLDASNNVTNQKFGEISKYIRFVDGKIILGESGSELTLTVQNDRVSFQQSGNEVAYFSNNNLYIRRAEVLTTLRVGNFEFAPRYDGGLILKKRGN